MAQAPPAAAQQLHDTVNIDYRHDGQMTMTSQSMNVQASFNFNEERYGERPDNEVLLRQSRTISRFGRASRVEEEQVDPGRIVYIPFGVGERNNTIINYTNIMDVGKHALGIHRFHFFFSQLNRANLLRPSAGRADLFFGVHMIFHDLNSPGPNYRDGIAVNFGTTEADGVSMRIVHDDNAWPYDIMSANLDEAAVVKVSTFIARRGAPGGGGAAGMLSRKDFVQRLKRAAVAALPIGYETYEDLGRELRLMNLFLIVMRPAPAGGSILESVLDAWEMGEEFPPVADSQSGDEQDDMLLDASELEQLVQASNESAQKQLTFLDEQSDKRKRVSSETVRRTPDMMLSSHSVFFPREHDSSSCFWVCVLYAMSVRENKRVAEADGSPPHPVLWYTRFAQQLLPYVRMHGRRMVSTKAFYLVNSFKDEFMSNNISEHITRERVDQAISVDMVPHILSQLGWFTTDVCVINDDAEPLVGELGDVGKYVDHVNGLMLCLVNAHYGVVRSYVSFLKVKVCFNCNKRFNNGSGLTRHLSSMVCFSCCCISMRLLKGGDGKARTKFDSYEQYHEHISNRKLLCPMFTEFPEGSAAVRAAELSIPKQRRNLLNQRFPHDKNRSVVANKQACFSDTLHDGGEVNAFLSTFTSNTALESNFARAMFFDLESVAPLNSHVTDRKDLLHQEAYACAWGYQDELQAGIIHDAYGADCLDVFIRYLENVYTQVLGEETTRFYHLVKTSVESSPMARVSGKKRNMTSRVLRSWSKVITTRTSCPVCQRGPLSLEHGFSLDACGRYTFSHCALDYYAVQSAEKNMKMNFTGTAPRISIYAHNGGRYDWLFVHRYFMERGRNSELQCIRGNGKYINLRFKDIFYFRDSFLFLSSSLEKLAINFGVETLKGVFPYRLMSHMDMINDVIVGEYEVRRRVPAEFMQLSEKVPGPMGLSKKRAMSEEEYVEWFGVQRGWIYDVRKETMQYLRDDVCALMQVFSKFRDGWKEMPYSPELYKYDTIGQMTHDFFLSHFIQQQTYSQLDSFEDDYIRSALFGGRTEVFRRVADPLLPVHYVDVNSLYPYVMESRLLPCGEPTWYIGVDETELRYSAMASKFRPSTIIRSTSDMEQVVHMLNACEQAMYGFFEVDVEVVNPREVRYPVLPERVSAGGGTYKNMFTCTRKVKATYYSEELKYAVQRGYRVTKVYSYCLWERGAVYTNIISLLKEQKMLGEGCRADGVRDPALSKNPSLRAAAKIAQNSLFGKTIQRIMSKVDLVDNMEDLWKYVKKDDAKVRITPVFRSAVSDVVEVSVTQTSAPIQRKSCAAIGAAILAEARMVLYDYFEVVEGINGELLYCDTDSIVFSCERGLPEQYLHDTVYGKMKVEIPPDNIRLGGFVAAAPKFYAFDTVNGPYVRCKGVNLARNVVTRSEADESMDGVQQDLTSDVSFDEEDMETIEILQEMRDGGAVHGLSFDNVRKLIEKRVKGIRTENLQFYKSKDRLVSAVETVKFLMDKFDKRRLLADGTTVPWTEFNSLLPWGEDTVNPRVVSDFMQRSLPEDVADFYEVKLSSSDASHVTHYADLLTSWRVVYDESFACFSDYVGFSAHKYPKVASTLGLLADF